MADVVKNVKKKKSRRLKRSVRRTLGTLFLVSALVVAAIPTDGLGREVRAYPSSANEASYKSELTWEKLTKKNPSKIPLVPANCKDIYSDENGLFYFAWYNEQAVILEYTGKELPGGALTIPDSVDAYAQMSANAGQTTGYVAISRERDVLYYMSTPYSVKTKDVEVPSRDTNGNPIKDETGKDVMVKKTVFDSYQPPVFSYCSREDPAWKVADITATYLANNFYYRVSDPGAGNYIDVETLCNPEDADGYRTMKAGYEAMLSNTDSIIKGSDGKFYKRSGPQTSHQWICNQGVRYIGNQYLVDNTDISNTGSTDVQVVQTKKIAVDKDGEAFVNEEPQYGVFNSKGNITTLTVGNQLLGIGNYAFYNCGGMTSIKLGNGLEEIGHDAFAYCDTMYLVDIPYNCNLTHIYDCAFAYSGMNTFALPQSVQYICDSAFEGCSRLREINLANIDLEYTKQQTFWNETTGQNDASEPRLSQMGCSVFKGCSSLKELTFPTKLSSNIHLDNFQGCSSLAHVTMLGRDAGFVGHDKEGEKEGYSVADFKKDVSPEIYFESYGTSKTHEFTKENVIAFKYIDDVQQYEIILIVDGTGGKKVKLTYQVDGENNSLYDFEMDGKVSKVEIPTQIGPKFINSISARCFADNCNLTKIVIPASITSIGDNAFKGCHNLRHVIFDDSSTVGFIGADAFRTQVMLDGHYSGSGETCGGSFASDVSLTFTGLIATNNGAGNVTGPFAYAMNADNTISNNTQAPTYITYYSGWPTLLEVKYDAQSGKSMLMDYPTIYDLRKGIYTAQENGEYKYPFMNDDYFKAVITALKRKYGEEIENVTQPEDEQETSGYAEALNNAVMNIVLPYGVESIKPDLFVVKEEDEKVIHPINTPEDTGVPKQLTAYGLKEVEDGAFKGFKNLTKVNLADSTIELGSYAFDGCEKLTTAVVPMTLEKLGLRPFKDCKNLSSVSFSGSPKFTVSDGIIYELDESGNKVAVVECLGMRTGGVSKTELAGIRTLYPEAFMGSRVGSVNLSASYISNVPAFAFAYTDNLYAVTLPSTVDYIHPNVFKNSSISELYIPKVSTQVDNLALGDEIYGDKENPGKAKDFWSLTHSYPSVDAAKADGVGVWTNEEKYGFSHTTDPSQSTDMTSITIYCEDDSMAKKNFADRYHIKTSNDFDKSYVVNFYDEDGVTKLIDTQTVERNEGAIIPDMSDKVTEDGRVFVQWQPTWADPNCIVADTDFTAYFADPLTEYCTITFWKDYTFTESFASIRVEKGTTKEQLEASGQIPVEKVEAYATSISRRFLEWLFLPDVINEDANPIAQYDALSWKVDFVDKDEPDVIIATQKVLDGDNATDFIPAKEGYEFNGWLDSLENVTSDRTIRALFLKKSLTGISHIVTFYKDDGTVDRTQKVLDGEDAVVPNGPTKEGYTFTGWQPAANLLNVTKDVEVMATYEKGGNGDGDGSGNGDGNGDDPNGGTAITHTVTFYDYDGTVYKTRRVFDGEDAEEPVPPSREGYTFTGWQPAVNLLNVTKDVEVTAQYEKDDNGQGGGAVVTHTVTFYDYDSTVYKTRKVFDGEDAEEPVPPTREGYIFTGWLPASKLLNVTGDVEVWAQYEKDDNGQNGGTAITHTVTFFDYDGKVIESLTQKVLDGENAVVPVGPSREGYIFTEWQPAEMLINITKDVYVTAQYEKVGNDQNSGDINTHTVTFYDHDGKVYRTQKVIDGEDAVEPMPPSRKDYTFKGWQPAAKLLKVTEDVYVIASYEKESDNSSNNNNNNNNNNNTTSGNTASSNSSKRYILTVQNGSGSGSYAAGDQPIIIANDPSSGYEFSHWTVAPTDTPIASTALSASVITMPATNVTVTANYKTKTSSSGTGSSSNTNGNTNSNRPNGTTGTVTNGGTTVVIDKNGLSNTGVVSAVVNGSSDNFTIKISESSAATEAILRALIAEYGNDLNNIKYFPMDISLYDSTGNTKITDTTGLRISITLPLPDSLIPYAGNNKVAGVVNERLDKLSPRFTTIDGVSCVTFTAEHFSPYVIYVDISRLSDGTVADSTPKTGDGIHPKWFLSIGLACLSFVMFMQKDNKKKQKVKVKAKAKART